MRNGIFTLFFSLVCTVAFSQHTIWQESRTDYTITFGYSGLWTNHCNCSETRHAYFALNNHQGPLLFQVSGLGTSGDFTNAFGPSYSRFVYSSFRYTGLQECSPGLICAFCTQNCDRWVDLNPAWTIWTDAIYNPTNVQATDGDFDTKIVITWAKGTDIPNANHSYRIYRNNVQIGTVSGAGPYTFTDSGRSPGETFTYKVTTYTANWGGQESGGITDQGSTFNVGLVASKGAFTNRVNLKWNDLSLVSDEIRIERSIPGTANKEEVAILSKSAKSYNDQDGIPGYSYTYYVTPISTSNTFLSGSDSGYTKPNGSIKGHVRSKIGVGVSGVTIRVKLLDTILAGGAALPSCGTGITYCTTTDVDGYYELKNIYYYTSAEFTIEPYKVTNGVPHVFTPDSSKRVLDENIKTHSGVDFTDESVYSVGGRVTYPEHNSTVCGVPEVKILLDGGDAGIKTDADGYWAFALSEEKNYSFKPVFKHHHFENPDGDDSTIVFVNSSMLDIDFENKTTDSLLIVVQGGCEASLADSIYVTISSGTCYYEELLLESHGYMMLTDLPAREYEVVVTELRQHGNTNLANIFGQIGDKPININLIERDSATTYEDRDSIVITPADTIWLDTTIIDIIPADTTTLHLTDTITGPVFPEARYIYRSPLLISIDWEEAGADLFQCNSGGNNLDLVILEQEDGYVLPIEVKESLGDDCYVDKGNLRIYDYISDRGDQAITVPIIGGVAHFPIIGGQPNVAVSTFHLHEKLLYVIPEVDLAPKTGVDFWAVVEGLKTNTPSFVTRSPDIPLLILHDPPGDQSYAYVEAGKTFKTFTQNEVLVGGEAGFYLDLLLGAKFITPFSGHGFGTKIKFSAVAGKDNFDRNGIETSITFTERYETSSDPNLTGHAGDVYIGAAFNQGFSLAEQLLVDKVACAFDLDIIPALSVESFATSFVYTETHIKNTLIPTFGVLIKGIINDRDSSQLTEDEKVEVNLLRRDSLDWENILKMNAANRDSLATFKENISFSAGAQLSKEMSIDTTTTVSYESNIFFNTEFALGAKIDNKGGIWFDSELGVMGKFRVSVNKHTGNDTTEVRTTGFILSDGDIGDFFSVDILEDVAYSVPAFRLKLGTSSCPQEPGTQARDRPQIEIFPPERNGVPADGAAQFVAQLTNLSESFETREYAVRVITTTNPDGAMVSLGSESINNFPQLYFLERSQTLNVTLSVEKGPLATNYERIGIMMYPECEYELWQNNGTLINADTAWITVNFQTECTNVSIVAPDDGWLINQNSDDFLRVTLSGYDVNNPHLESISVQIKREGQGYQTPITIQKEDLIGPFYDAYLNVSNLPDGEYRIRARANCGFTHGYTYSSELLGTIDRSSLAPFGTPSPSDGFLQEGQKISVTFDKQINCALNTYDYEASLMRLDDSTMIDIASVQCFGNEIILVTDPPLIERPELNNVRVEAFVHHIEDQVGNAQSHPVKWSFLVNVRPVFWDPEEVHQTAVVGTPERIKGVLKNNAKLSKAYTLVLEDAPDIVMIPDWLTPVQKRGTILSNNSYEVEFIPDADLAPGIYFGTVVAAVDGQAIELDVTYEVLAHPVNWQFDASKFENSMNLVMQFSLTQANAPLSTDTRDAIAAFVNGEIRGIANIKYVPEVDKYVAFMTVYSNSTGGGGGETVRFRFWKALSGVEYGAVETRPFVPNGTEGNPLAPVILHPEGIYQVIPLNKGWNWVSFNVSTSDLSREKTFQSLIYPDATNTITVKSQTSTTIYSPGSGWNGNLQNMLLGPGYMVHLSSHGDTLRTVGLAPVNPVALSVGNTWNWIGFPEQVPRDVDSVLVDLTPQVGHVLKSQHAFAQFTLNNGWVGNLNMFEPGKSYRFRHHTAGTLTFRDKGKYVVPRGDYEFNMNITGTLDPEKLNNSNYTDLLVGAFIDDLCYGVADVEYVPALNEYRTLLLVSGDLDLMDQNLTFKVLNTKTGKEYVGNGDLVAYAPDAIRGTILNPYQIFTDEFIQGKEDDYALMQNNPNPVSDIAQIDFRIPIDTRVQIHLYDINGTLVKTIADYDAIAGWRSVQFNVSDLLPGVYIYRMTTDAFSATKKLSKH